MSCGVILQASPFWTQSLWQKSCPVEGPAGHRPVHGESGRLQGDTHCCVIMHWSQTKAHFNLIFSWFWKNRNWLQCSFIYTSLNTSTLIWWVGSKAASFLCIYYWNRSLVKVVSVSLTSVDVRTMTLWNQYSLFPYTNTERWLSAAF